MIVDMEVAKETVELILTCERIEVPVQQGNGGSEIVNDAFDVGLVICEGVRTEEKVKELHLFLVR